MITNKDVINFSDCLRISGNLSIPESIKNEDTLYQFPYKEYLAKDNIYLLLNVKKFEKVDSCQSINIYQKLQLYFLNHKIKITKMFLDKYDQPYAGLVAGVLIAGKGLMNKDTLDMFKRVSLSHVVVLSGSNVSIIILSIKFIFDNLFLILRLKKNFISDILKKILIILCITSFVLLTGGGAPIYRAFISSVFGLIIFNNKTSQLYSLTIVVLIMTIINPMGSLYDPSFHLTCCATYGLIMFTKSFDDFFIYSKLNFIPTFFREIISVTLATQVYVFPYILFMSGSFSSVFLISNVLILPLISFVMFLGFMSLFPLIDSVCIFLNNIILKLIFYLVDILANIPFGYFEFNKKISLIILIVYGFVFLFLLKWIKK